MRTLPARTAAALVIGTALLGACSASRTGTGATPSAGASGHSLPTGSDPVDLDQAAFSAEITNRYWPMSPGSRWAYRETDADGSELVATVTVSSETRDIANGITARVVRDSVTRDGVLIEDTFDWYAQDADGNVWYLGEDTAEFENGAVTSTSGSFEAGVDGALPGIMIPGAPADGMRYRQEYYAGEAEDNGEVLSTDELAEVPFGNFSGVLLTKDTITIQPDVQEYKLYAPDVGPVLILGISGGGGREELVSFETVSADAAAAAGTTPLGESYP